MDKVNGVDSIQWKKNAVTEQRILKNDSMRTMQAKSTTKCIHVDLKFRLHIVYCKSSPKANITIGIMRPQIAKVKLWWKWLHRYNRSFNTVSEIVIDGLIRFFPIPAPHNVWLAITNECHKCYSPISTPNVRISMNLNTMPIIKLPC